MNKMIKLAALLAVIAVAACNNSNAPEEAAETETTETEAAPSESHVFDTQKEALEKAKQVEQTIMDADQQMRQQLDRDSK